MDWRLHREHGWTKSHRTFRRAHRSHARRGGILGLSGSMRTCSDPVAERHFAMCRFKMSLLLDKNELNSTFVKTLLCSTDIEMVYHRYLKSLVYSRRACGTCYFMSSQMLRAKELSSAMLADELSCLVGSLIAAIGTLVLPPCVW